MEIKAAKIKISEANATIATAQKKDIKTYWLGFGH